MLTIRLLGGLEVSRGAGALALPPSRKTRALLAYLVVTRRAHRRERLCELLWDVPDDPRGALRWSLTKLRGLVDEPGRSRIVADRDTVAFAPDDAAVDLWTLRELVKQGSGSVPLPSLARAAGTMRGALLEGLDLPGSFAFQAWLAAEREEARRQAAALLRALAEGLADEPARALEHARRLVDLEPHDEAARAALVRLLLALDRRDEAKQHHESGIRLLADAGAPAA
jgi:DNA-binding SARP family transcriptional activator